MSFPDYPDNSCYAIVNNHRMHYLRGGDINADPVVMLHGNPAWSFYYRHLFNSLIDQYHCIVPDHIGMGLSAKPGDTDYNFTLRQRVDDLEALLSALQIDNNLTLIVHDWGGMIGLAYATRYPHKIRRLVVSNTAGFHLPAGKHIPWSLRLSRTPGLGCLLIRGFNLFCRAAVARCVTRRPMASAVKQAYLAPYAGWAQRLSVLRFVEDIPLDKHHAAYAMVDTVDKNLQQFSHLPVLICWGLNDFVFDTDFLNEWKRRLPEAEYHEFDAGHYLLEDAGDAVIPVVQSFLEKNPLK